MSLVCEYCGAPIQEGITCKDLYYELSLYTLAHPDQHYFIHQLVVDAYAAQHVTKDSKPVAVAGALVGLYLVVEHGYTGKQVQQVHMKLGNHMKEWMIGRFPTAQSSMTVASVLAAAPGQVRDDAIGQWVQEVWKLWKFEKVSVGLLLKKYLKNYESRP